MNTYQKTIIHIITSTDVGGTEQTLFNFLSIARNGKFKHRVISLAPIGAIGKKIDALGVPIISMDLHPDLSGIFSVARLYDRLREASPSLVHCWMYHANLLGGLAARWAGIPSIWSIRHHDLNPELLKKSTILIAHIGARLSHILPARIIYCAQSSRVEHERIGYHAGKGLVIPNGFDTRVFAPDPARRQANRARLSIPPDALVIGHVGRFHPTKGHHDLLRAARLICNKQKNVIFLLCVSNVETSNSQLQAWIHEMGLNNQVMLTGLQTDMPAFYNTLDILISSSLSESLPNVIGEAMSCGIPCVATDTGGSSYLVGDSGVVVPVSDPSQLAAAIIQLVEDQNKRHNLGESARKRILNAFNNERMAGDMDDLYTFVLRESVTKK